jgi:UDP-N-acetylglucosamine 3-dehydrogenase
MADHRLGIAVLGAGAMGAEHAWVLSQFPDVRLVGVCSRALARAETLAGEHGVRAFDDAAALMALPEVDAVDVCTPSAAHAGFAIAALELGRHVFCETPMTLDLAEARRMRDVARSAGRLLQVGLLMRSAGPYAHVQAVAGRGELGRLLSLSAWRLGSYLRPGASDHKAHYSDPSTELMTFDFDFANWLFGAPARLSATGVAGPQGRPGEISALVSYAGGGEAAIVGSGLMPVGTPFTAGFRALFEEGVFELRNVFAEGPPATTFTLAAGGAAPTDVASEPRNPYEVELRRFVDCAQGRADPALLDADRAIEALTLSLAARQAIEERRTVEISAVS